MRTFDLVSDLHDEFWPGDAPESWTRHRRADLLVVAGDIADDPAESARRLRQLARIWPEVVFVDGNHEHQRAFPDLDRGVETLRRTLADVPNVTLLFDRPFIRDGLAVIGRNGWWDYRLAEPRVMAATSREAFARALKMDESGNDRIAAQAHADATALAQEVRRLQDDPSVRDILVVTHTLPRPELLSWGVYPPRTEFAGCYGNAGMADVAAADRERKIRGWVFGHNHDARDLIADGIRFVSNPRGRPSEFNRQDYRPRHFEVATMAQPAPAAALAAGACAPAPLLPAHSHAAAPAPPARGPARRPRPL